MSEEQDEFMKSLKENVDSGLIKVHFTLENKDGPAGESVWATPIGKKYAKINNIPFFVDDVSIDDIVEFQPSDSVVKEFVKLISRGSRKFHIAYDAGNTPDDSISHFQQLRDFLTKRKFKVEGAAAGFCAAAVSLEVTEEKARKIIKKAPHVSDFG